jgi:hypothetical protein
MRAFLFEGNDMAARDDMPNSVLGRFLSLEMLGMLVVIGVSWGALTARVSGLDEKLHETKEESEEKIEEVRVETMELKKDVSQMNRKLDVMGNNQEHFKDSIESLDDRTMKILDLLERRNGRVE